MNAVICTDDVPDTERFAYFREIVFRESSPMDVACARPAGFSARLRRVDLGPVTVMALATRTPECCEVRRDPALIRRSDPDAYRLVVNLRGHGTLVHNGRQISLAPGTLTLLDTSLPFHGERSPGVDRCLFVRIPRDLLPLPARTIRQVVGAELDGRSGVGALLTDVAVRTVQDAEHYRPACAHRLSAALVDLLEALLAQELEATASSPQDALFHRIEAFVHDRLGDPALSPGTIAAAHHISTRSLHALFRARGLTVAGHVRARRLDRCHRDLADPLLAGRPVHAIAARWGFTDAAHFSRTFKAAYGTSPRAVRGESTTTH
ncbi:AraC family transcriptional regulator [Actinomadura craniellae]|uniref:AraC family transcriptional regulator n=1 Tax=Actinomadura craniellae TaxID=2231787 RepID=A0A365H461_9ACTN|nr:helix-turn-helix domain-containing protein [Actinomadura craniellae]RAY13796.1 AraC family transcriptional regulator [Actinomadura craniellae]